MTQSTKMTTDEMQAVLDAAQPGDKLRIVFADKPVDKYRILTFMAIFMSDTPTLRMDMFPMANLAAVHDSESWCGFRGYEVEVLTGFDAEDLNYRTVRHGILESITKL